MIVLGCQSINNTEHFKICLSFLEPLNIFGTAAINTEHFQKRACPALDG
jgi:hypothetical protein